jgi:hypothetical protein
VLSALLTLFAQQTPRDADAAIARFDGTLINNRNLKVKRAHREWRDRVRRRWRQSEVKHSF